jgi:hypothetical protein
MNTRDIITGEILSGLNRDGDACRLKAAHTAGGEFI